MKDGMEFIIPKGFSELVVVIEGVLSAKFGV